jgi:PucR family transcriptional regulator, purine catabolism regulatory protein
MHEITLGDLCRWDRRLELYPATGEPFDTALDRGVSWVVSVRTSPPLLPPLRGDELVVIPRRVLDQIEQAHLVDRAQLLNSLLEQRVCGVLTEPGFFDDAATERFVLPVVTMPAPFPQEAESTFNRLLTERRAELYRLGNDLSRGLSQAAMDPRGVEGILEIASSMAGRTVVLQDMDGQLIGSAGNGDPESASIDELEYVRTTGQPATIRSRFGRERLIVPVEYSSGIAFLSVSAEAGALTEVDRLVLSQTSGTAAIVLAQGNAIGVRSARQQAISEILEGRLASDAAVIARARGLGIDPTRPLIVGIISTLTGDPEASRRFADQLLGGLRTAHRTEHSSEVAFLVSRSEGDELNQRIERLSARDLPEKPVVTLGSQIENIVEAPASIRQARFARGLVAAGILPKRVVWFDSLDDTGVFGLLYHLWGNPAAERFRSDVLGALEEYDRRRGTALIETLRAYLSSGGSASESAGMLRIHRNTLAYRVSRIAEISGRDLNNANDRLMLRIALLCLDLAQVEEE